MPLGDRLKRAREDRGWSQAELARRAGIRQATLCELETGKQEDTRVSTLVKLAKALRVSLEYLTEMEYDPLSPPEQPAVESNAALATATDPERTATDGKYSTPPVPAELWRPR